MTQSECESQWGIWNGDQSSCSSITCVTVFHVPADYSRIQKAINFAGDGFEIIVAPGTWTGDMEGVINTHGKAVTIVASGSADETILTVKGKPQAIIVLHEGEGRDTVIRGFTIRGDVFGSEARGIYLRGSSPTIEDCVITGCGPSAGGGGIYCINGASPAFNNCSVTGNSAATGGGVSIVSSEPTFTHCQINDNTANDSGGGVAVIEDGFAVFSDCSISENTAGSAGGGLLAKSSGVNLNGTSLENNTSGARGGGAAIADSHVTVVACVISGNHSGATSGGGLAITGAPVSLQKTTVCGNAPGQISGPWDDEGGNTVEETCPGDCPADLDGNGSVGITDLLSIIDQWGACSDDCTGDLDGDGSVGIADLLIVLDAWGECD